MAVFRDIEKIPCVLYFRLFMKHRQIVLLLMNAKEHPMFFFRSCRYSVPRSYAYSVVKYKITAGKIHIYDEDLRFLCTHLLSERRGSFNQLRNTVKVIQETGLRSWNGFVINGTVMISSISSTV